MILKSTTVLVGSALLVAATAPTALASGGPGSGGAGAQPSSNCQIKQLQNTPVLLLTSAGIDTTQAVAGCASSSWSVTYLNTALGTTDFTATGPVGANGTKQSTVHAAPLPYNYPYQVTLTVVSAAGSVLATKSGSVFTPKPHD